MILWNTSILKSLHRNLPLIKIKVFKSTFRMVKRMGDSVLVFKHIPGDERFFVNFHLKTDSLEREFNFNRRSDESVSNFLDALSHKVDKMKEKKNKKKKMNQEVKSGDPSPVFFRLENQKMDLSEDLASDILSKANVSLDICGKVFRVEKNPPYVELLNLSDRIMVGFPCYPSKFEMSFGQREYSIFNWYTSEDPNSQKKWTLVQDDNYVFTPKIGDVGKFVKLEVIPRNETQCEGITTEIVSKCAIDVGPGSCPFEKRHEFTKSITDDSLCRVVSYNLLADLYADSDFSRKVLFPSCPPFALSINYRKQLILKELIGYNADILCLQEVDRKVYKRDLDPLLSKVGFDSVFETKGGDLAEGLACFWRKSKFNLINSEVNVMSELLKGEETIWNDLRAAINAKPELEESIMKRKTAFLTVTLQPENTSRAPIVVGVTHLFFQPNADHIRLLQTEMCLRHLRRVVSKLNAHLLFCGDFNSVPTNAVYEYLLSGHIPKDHEDWQSCPGQEVEGLSLSHDLSLDSGCGTPKYTNYTLEFKDCLDYIFYDKKGFSVDQIVPFPSVQELGDALPNVHFPSDHIACIADLKWK